MSAESTLVFFGLRFALRGDEIETVDERSDARVKAARAARLNHYHGNFGGEVQRHYLFVGKRLAVIGVENSSELIMATDQLEKALSETAAKLREAGFQEPASLYVQWEPDV